MDSHQLRQLKHQHKVLITMYINDNRIHSRVAVGSEENAV
ncbi:Protein of unknown function [Pyronema omphalodes CBS 100304]|uniref:Uncharacterized protein n=1 Tax=Pyronema omphalodes (strain CBS 100304) TaxID=1076935 RepID=U4L2V3_PYROM|nr:Protein of unknown function [Pyronema omphalodes CBS 100304]